MASGRIKMGPINDGDIQNPQKRRSNLGKNTVYMYYDEEDKFLVLEIVNESTANENQAVKSRVELVTAFVDIMESEDITDQVMSMLKGA